MPVAFQWIREGGPEMTKRTLIIVIVSLVSTAMVSAHDFEDVDVTLSFAWVAPDAIGAAVYIVPDGSGLPFTEAFAPGGESVDATITLALISHEGDPVVGFPVEDIWLETTGGSLTSCVGGTSPDAPTDDMAETHWVLPLRAGGYTEGEMVRVMFYGVPIAGAGLPIHFRSADLDGDLQVNLTDIALFTPGRMNDDPACDFNHDGVVDLADIARFTQALGTACP